MKWLWFSLCIAAGLILLACGLLIPVHLRAADAGVLQSAGRKSPALLVRGQSLADQSKLGAAQLLVEAANMVEVPGRNRLGLLVTNLVRQNPRAYFWGDDAHLEYIFANNFDPLEPDPRPFTDFLVQQKNRTVALVSLRDSAIPAVQELLRSRSLKNTVLFPPSQSAAGQAYDTAVSVCGLLLDNRYLTANLSANIFTLASAANHGNSSQPLEQVLMDFLSLGERFNWDQLTSFVGQIQGIEALHRLADQAHQADGQLPVLFAAVQLSSNPAGVADYAANFKASGLPDLAASLRYGAGGVNLLAKLQQRFYGPAWERKLAAFNPFGAFYYSAADLAFRQPGLALGMKWLCYCLAGFFLAAAAHHARPAARPLERPLQVRGVHWAREFLFSLGFLLVVLILSEPFLAQENLKESFSFRLALPTAGGAVPAGIAGIKQTIMNPVILLTLLIFFVLQALLYLACLVKLAEIRRQHVPPRMKLKLLENEDHLFDAGLYLGFVGTIVSLIVASLGLVKFSLMAAYSSTSFGIVFVVIFKIFHLRPARRMLLLEAESGTAEAQAPMTPPTPALPS